MNLFPQRFLHSWSTHKVLLFTVSFLLLFSLASYAVASFTPGQTLDPNCSPGDSGCYVEIATNIGSSIGSGTAGSVLYLGTSGVLAQDNANLFFDSSNIRLGVGTSSPAATIHAVDTTEQMRLGYDASNYYSTTVGTTGGVTFNAVGSGSAFLFSDNVGINNATPQTKLHIVDTSAGARADLIRLANTGVGQGTAAGIGFGFGAANTFSPAFISAPYTSPGATLQFATGGGGASANANGTVALTLNADQTATFASSVTAVGHYDITGGTAAFRNNGADIITRSGTNLVFADNIFWQGLIFETNNVEALRMNSSGNVGIGTGSTVSARAHIISTTEQLRVGYDASNYLSTTVGSTGNVTFDAVGSGGGFTFDGGIFSKVGYTNTGSTTFRMGTGYELYGVSHASGGYEYYLTNNTGLDSGYQINFGTNSNKVIQIRHNAVIFGQPVTIGTLSLGNLSNFESSPYTGFEYSSGTGWSFAIRGSDDLNKFVISNTGNVGIGTGTGTVSARTHIISTTEQLRVGYDTSNYISLTVGSTGVVALATSATGNSQYFTFNKDIAVQSITVGRGPGGVSTNTVIGYQAFNSNSTTAQSTVIGYQAGYNTGATFYETFVGYQAGYSTTTGDSNTAIGRRAMYSNQTGYSNVALGDDALYNATSYSNVAVGFQAGRVIGAGNHNVYVGQGAGGSNTTNANTNSVGIGSGALANGGSSNVAVGFQALDVASSASASNVALGSGAGGGLTSGSTNIFIGRDAGAYVSAASNNIYIGNYPGTGFETSSGNIFISEAGGSATVRLHVNSSGNLAVGGSNPSYRLDVLASAVTFGARVFTDGNDASYGGLLVQAGLDDHTAAGPSTLIGFRDGDGTTVGSITFGSSATAYNTTSDRRLKDDITDSTAGLSLLNQIKVRDYTFIADESNTTYQGFIAQELYDVYPRAVTRPVNEEEGYWMVDYSKLMPLVVNAIQDLDMKVDTFITTDTDTSLLGIIRSFLANTSNGITQIYAGIVKTNKVETQQLCVGNTCVTEAQLQNLLNSYNPPATYTPVTEEEPTPEEEEVVAEDPIEETPTEEPVEEVVEEPQEEVIEDPVEEEPAPQEEVVEETILSEVVEE